MKHIAIDENTTARETQFGFDDERIIAVDHTTLIGGDRITVPLSVANIRALAQFAGLKVEG
jgi:hypothetical protein